MMISNRLSRRARTGQGIQSSNSGLSGNARWSPPAILPPLCAVEHRREVGAGPTIADMKIRSASDALASVELYHRQTKHHFFRYARSLGMLDWANQPDPFRRY